MITKCKWKCLQASSLCINKKDSTRIGSIPLFYSVCVRVCVCMRVCVCVCVCVRVCIYFKFVPYIVNQFSVSVWEQHVAGKGILGYGFFVHMFFCFFKVKMMSLTVCI